MIKNVLFFLIVFVFASSGKSQNIDLVYEDSEEDGLIHLTWNPTNVPGWDSLRINYRLEGETSFQYLNTTFPPETSYTDTVHCDGSVVYQAFLFYQEDTLAFDPICPNAGVIDEIDPEPLPPVLYSLSYEDDSIRMEWEKTSDVTALGYYSIIHQFDSYDTLEIIGDQEASSIKLLNNMISPCTRQDAILLITYDGCSSSPNVTSDYLQALTLITDLDYQPCNRRIEINFKEYLTSEAINQTILRHEIWVSENGATPFLLETISSPASSYLHTNIQSGSTFEYTMHTILDIDGEKTALSESCPKSIDTEAIPLPDFFTIQNATVTSNNEVKLIFEADTSADITGFRIYRTGEDDETELIAEFGKQQETRWSYTDTTATPAVESYRYFAEVIDACGLEAMPAEHPSRTVFLTVTTEDTENTLEWSAYEGWEVGNYVVYRFSAGYDTTEVAMVSGSTYTLTDTPSANPAEGQWHYYVVAVSAEGPEESHSNAASANRATFFQVPTAFRPAGNTSYVFKPVFVSLPPSGYQLLIYNRWGQLIFETTDPERGWDGTFDGEPAPMGTYVYFIRYQDNNNQPNEEKGTVVLIR